MSHPHSSRTTRILLVEDCANLRLLYQWFLTEYPCLLDIAGDGETALSIFLERQHDIILVDVQMPGMDGLTVTREIRKMEKRMGRPPAPVIALTANASKEDEILCKKAGCSGYLAKPVQKDVLLETIRKTAG